MGITGPVNGSDMLIYRDGVALAHATSQGMSLSHSPRNTTSKDSGKATNRAPGQLDGSFSAEGLVVFDQSPSLTELYDTYNQRLQVQIRFSTESSGDNYYQAQAYITSLDVDSGPNENVTYSAEFEVDGEVVQKAQS